MFFAGVLALALGFAQPNVSRQPPTEGDTVVEGVVVTGRRETTQARREAVAEFVRDLARPTRRGRLARWERTVCPGVVGLPERHGSYIVERIADEAHALGVRVGRPGCRPDILILVTNQADQAASDFQTQYGNLLAARPDQRSLTSGGSRDDLNVFLTSDRPVRAWHVSTIATADGRPLSTVSLGGPGGVKIPAISTTTASRMSSNFRDDLARVLMIVDTTKLRGVTYEQLASYLSMAALAQLDLESDPGSLSSIMNVFADRDGGRTPAESLTSDDRAYLRGLYAARADARSLRVQQNTIRRSLNEGVGG